MTRIKYGYLHWTDTDIFIQKIENISQKVTQDNVNDFSINDVLEIYNILRWMKSDKKIYQKQEVLNQLSLQYKNILEKYLGRYMNHIIDENFQNLYGNICISIKNVLQYISIIEKTVRRNNKWK